MNLYWPERIIRSRRLREAKRRRRWQAAEARARTHLLLSHGHCLDGVGAALLTERALGKANVGTAFVQPNDMAEALAFFSSYDGNGRTLLVADLSLQKDQYPAIVASCRTMRAKGWTIEWRDHHHKQWEGLDMTPLRAELRVLEVNADATESGASLQQKALLPKDVFAKRLAATIRDRDLWWNKTPDGETLEFALSELGTKDFMASYADANDDTPSVPPAISAAAQREKDRQAQILGTLLGQARYWGEGAAKVGIVYGWLPKNTGLHELINDHGCAVAVNVRPNGKMSLRSRKGADVCHLVAQQFSGGGHPNASGGDLGLRGPSYWWYIVRHGRVGVVERVAQAALKQLGA